MPTADSHRSAPGREPCSRIPPGPVQTLQGDVVQPQGLRLAHFLPRSGPGPEGTHIIVSGNAPNSQNLKADHAAYTHRVEPRSQRADTDRADPRLQRMDTEPS